VNLLAYFSFIVCNLLQVTQCYFDGGYQETPVYVLESLQAGHDIPGPAIIMNGNR